jgi:hypothetical protein
LWLLRDLPALIGIAWSFWPLMILVISSGRRAMRGKQVDRSVYDALMQMLPIAEARLRFALHRQAYRVLGWNPRAIALDPVDPVASWSDFRVRFEAYRASMMDLHASADANAVRAAHGSTGALRAAHHEAVGAARSNGQRCGVALMVSSDRLAAPKRSGGRRERPSNHEGVLANARGPPAFHFPISRSPSLSAVARLRPHPHAYSARMRMFRYHTRSPWSCSAIWPFANVPNSGHCLNFVAATLVFQASSP